ncbi:MAG: DUF3159 domain-containing protein [Pseudonocardiaceae bacterium]
MRPARDPHPDSLTRLLGGRRSALDTTAPAVAFGLGWGLAGRSVAWGAGAALVAGVVAAVLRWRSGGRPVAALLGLLGVAVAVLVALRTGRAEDFFLTQLLSNVASALLWTVSILVRRPLLGLVVGGVLGQRTAWRRDRALLRAYGLASWVWVAQYAVRIAVFVPLYLAGEVAGLVAARVALSWPLVALCVAVSGVVLVRALPEGHPGLRHPVRE